MKGLEAENRIDITQRLSAGRLNDCQRCFCEQIARNVFYQRVCHHLLPPFAADARKYSPTLHSISPLIMRRCASPSSTLINIHHVFPFCFSSFVFSFFSFSFSFFFPFPPFSRSPFCSGVVLMDPGAAAPGKLFTLFLNVVSFPLPSNVINLPRVYSRFLTSFL